MSLSVEKIGGAVLPVNIKGNKSAVSSSPVCSDNKILNLNENPNSVYFKGLFSDVRRLKEVEVEDYDPAFFFEEEIKRTPEEVFHLSEKQLENSKQDAHAAIVSVLHYMDNEILNGRNGNLSRKGLSRTEAREEEASETLVNLAAQYLIAHICYYSKSNTNCFGEFYNLVLNGIPNRMENLSLVMPVRIPRLKALYKATMKIIEDYGKKVMPISEYPIDTGIRFLYFADDIPGFKPESRGRSITMDEALDDGQFSKLTHNTGYAPRSHTSIYKDEISHYGTGVILCQYSVPNHPDFKKYKGRNVCGHKSNKNFDLYVPGWKSGYERSSRYEDIVDENSLSRSILSEWWNS